MVYRVANECIFNFNELCSTTMEEILNFIYTSQLEVTENNVAQLLDAASIMEIQGNIKALN